MPEKNGRKAVQKRTQNHFAGFTLTELIVIITILAILWAVAFVSLSGYSRGARDSSRISTMSSVLKGLNISRQRVGKYPMPDSPRISLMNTGITFGYQGYAGNDAIRLAGAHGQTTDPVDGRYYVYSINLVQDKAQMLGYLEESGKHTIGYAGDGGALHNIPWEDDIFAGGLRTYAEGSDLSIRYPFVTGDTLGILLSSTGATKNQPVQDILTGAVDVSSGTVAASYTAYLSESSGSVSGTSIAETIPALYNPSATCGSSNGGGFVSAPTTGLCAIGSSTGAVNSGGSWVWTCSASNGTRASCGGSVSVVSPAACGTATATPTSTAPSSALCASGNPSAVGTSGSNWTWNCLDGGGSVLASCSVGILVSGACSTPPVNALFSNGSGSYTLSNAPYGTSLTASYNASPTGNTCQFSCSGGYAYSAGSCVPMTNGQCGTASSTVTSTGISFAPPTSNLCAVWDIAVSGTATPLSSSVGYTYQGSILKWTWSCNSPNGGANASCSVPSVSATQWQDYYSSDINSAISQNNWTTASDSFTSILWWTVGPAGEWIVLAQNGKIYVIPWQNWGNAYKFDPTNNSISTIATSPGKYGQAVLTPNGKIYAVPWAGWPGSVFVVNTTNDTTTSIWSWLWSYGGAILAPNGKIYAISCGNSGWWCDGTPTNNVLVIDPSNDSITTIAQWQISNYWFNGKLALWPNGKIYSSNSYYLGVGARIDPFTDTLTTFSLGCNDYGMQIAGNGKLYSFGYNNCSVSADPNNNDANTNLWGSIWSYGAALAPNGKLYGSPYSSSTTFYDPYGWSAPGYISGSPSGYYRPFVLAPNGKMYGFPANGSYTDIIVLTPGWVTKNFSSNTLLSPYINNN